MQQGRYKPSTKIADDQVGHLIGAHQVNALLMKGASFFIQGTDRGHLPVKDAPVIEPYTGPAILSQSWN